MRKFTYFPGCLLLERAKQYDVSNRSVCEELNISIPELKGWNCCGSTSGAPTSRALSLALAVKNLALAERKGRHIVTPCAVCFNRLALANLSIKKDERLRNGFSRTLNLEYQGKVEVKHLLDFYINEIGLETISRHVTKPLSGLKAVPYYGCLLVRPRMINAFDSVVNPQSLDKLIRVTGATCLSWSSKTKCCGASLMTTNEAVAMKLTTGLLLDAENSGAQFIISACPFCSINLEIKQIMDREPLKQSIPILYFTQLLGLALGINKKRLALEKNSVSPIGPLESINIL